MEAKRDGYLNQLIDGQGNGLIKIVTGIRRCGKSYLLFRLLADYLLSTGTPDDHIVRIDLENYRNKALRIAETLIEYIDSRITDDGHYFILLDDLQRAAHARFSRRYGLHGSAKAN